MARVDLPIGLEGSAKLPKTRKALTNLINVGDRILPRPGIDALNTTGTVARGAFQWNDSMYQVTGTRLIKITDKATGAFSVIDTIEGSGQVKWAVGFNHAAIVVPGAKTYALDKTDTVTDITGNTNFVPFADVTHIDGRFVFVPSDGSPTRFTDVGDITTINVLSFFDAEELPDLNNGVFNLKNTLMVGGPDSIEHFKNTGGFPIPFTRINSSRLLVGYIGGFTQYIDSVIFIGRYQGQSFGIFEAKQGQAQKISTEPVDEILKKYTFEELADVVTSRFDWDGYEILTFRLNRHSFGYFRGRWFLLDTVFDQVSRPWGGGFITQFEGEYFTAFEDRIGKLSEANADYGNPIARIIDTGLREEDNKRFTCQAIELGVSQGFNTIDGTVALMLSRDNVLYGPAFYRPLGKLGEYSKNLAWNYKGGLGSYDGFMGIRFYTTQNVNFSVDSLIARFR